MDKNLQKELDELVDKSNFIENYLMDSKGNYITKDQWDGLSFNWLFETIKDLEKNPIVEKGYVYLAMKNENEIKIGVCVNPKARLGSIQTQGNFKLEDRYISVPIQNKFEIEKLLHREFKSKRLKGEWFNESFEVLKKALIKIIDEIGKKTY